MCAFIRLIIQYQDPKTKCLQLGTTTSFVAVTIQKSRVCEQVLLDSLDKIIKVSFHQLIQDI